MKVKKIKREELTTTKWIIEGKGKGWIFDKTFPTKWKAKIALEVFKKGGKVSDYWKAARKYKEKRPKIYPSRVIEKLEEALDKIKELDPTCEEIEEYGKEKVSGVVTYTDSERYYPPHLHDTWRVKSGGRVHIDIGCKGVHLMLDQYYAYDFIEFIKDKRGKKSKK